MQDEKTAIFTLTRGYSGFDKYRYLKLIFRNLYIKRAGSRQKTNYTLLVFHEGNISRLDQVFITIFSAHPGIRFIHIKEYFEIPRNIQVPGTDIKALGYEMMCVFQYLRVWRYLKEYEIAIRIDDDCLVRDIPFLREDQIFACAAVSEEAHENTNNSLPVFLQASGDSQFYDHKFPYTNVYITRPKFWLQHQVQEYLQNIFMHETSIINRWGDLPVIGIILKKYKVWNYDEDILRNFAYMHLSHSSIVEDGKIQIFRNNRFKLFKNTIRKLIKWS
jgi:hypothetical protein